MIQCSVVVDKASITGATLNRGNCPDPILSTSNQEILSKFLNSATQVEVWTAKDNMETASNLFEDGLQVRMAESFEEAFEKLSRDRQIMIALFMLQYATGGTYQFGDKVILPLFPCNLLEYSIIVDGREWTWKVQ